jgi:putative flippase GtrA
MTGERARCRTPHVGRAQVGGIYKQLQKLGITECLNLQRCVPVNSDSRRARGGVACWSQAKRGDGMARLWKGFSSYTLIGVVNTLIHWQLFYVFSTALDLSQAVNFLAFCVAVSFSFYVNATYTFAMSASLARYLMFVVCMGTLSLGVGWLADRWGVPGIVTVMVFSLENSEGVFNPWLGLFIPLHLGINDHQLALATGKYGMGCARFHEVHLAGLDMNYFIVNAQAKLATDHQQPFVVIVGFFLKRLLIHAQHLDPRRADLAQALGFPAVRQLPGDCSEVQ